MLKLQEKYERALMAFRDRVLKEISDHIDAIIVYGSVARGEAGEGSDIDVLIISDEKGNITDRIFDISYDVDLEYGVAMSLAYLTPMEIEHRIKVGSPFIEDVLTQGVVLYDRDETFKRIRRRVLKAFRVVNYRFNEQRISCHVKVFASS